MRRVHVQIHVEIAIQGSEMGFSCKSKTAIAACDSTHDPGSNNGGILESFRFRELEAATSSFARESLILKASHGHIFRAVLHDGRVVAVKCPETGVRLREDADAFNNEVQILSKLFSRRLVNLLGYSHDGRAKFLVLEYMENGTLHENLLHPVAAMKRASSTAVSLRWPVRVKLALDIAKAIRALHASSPPIIHRNIRTSNVFLDRDGNARLGDFCLAKCMHEIERPRGSALISIPETSTEPERHSVGLQDFDYEESSSSSVSNPRVNPKTDVFSFGIVLLEIMSGRSVRDADHHAGALRLVDWALPLIKHGHFMAVCDPRITPLPDSAAVLLMASVAARCVRSSSARRPSMEEVVQCLSKASKLIPEPNGNVTTKSESLSTLTATRDHHPIPTTSRGREKLMTNADATASAPLNVRSSAWKGLTYWKKRTVVFRLSQFLARKFRIGAAGSFYNKLPVQKANSKGGSVTLLKGAKVSAVDGLRESAAVQEVLQHKNSALANGRECKIRRAPAATASSARFGGSSSHRSGRKVVKL